MENMATSLKESDFSEFVNVDSPDVVVKQLPLSAVIFIAVMITLLVMSFVIMCIKLTMMGKY